MRLLLFAAIPFLLLGQQSVTISSSGASQTVLIAPGQSTTVTLPTSTAIVTAQLSAQPASITLPIEVVGPANTTVTRQFICPAAPAAALTLYARVHNVGYDSEASVQVNNSVWLPISTGAVTLLGNANAFGGIGGGLNTFEFTIALPPGTVKAGINTISWRFNGTDGIRSGYRVLAFNVQAAGVNLIPAAVFVEDDPAKWAAPLPGAADIAAGKTLWQTAALSDPASGAHVSIKAHCSDCHTDDGRDLKYFNYSNGSIEARAEFHGLSSQQGQQIASYIRSLATLAPGRPWNPPYQPGPGMDSQPVANWAAGAGLAAVLPNDQALQQYLMPGGSTALFSATAYTNPRETPVMIQFPDWNRWLPMVWPGDAFGTTFTNSGLPNDPAAIKAQIRSAATIAAGYKTAVYSSMATQQAHGLAFYHATLPLQVPWTPQLRQAFYSVGLWEIVKQWEVNQELGLEPLASVLLGAKANPRGWASSAAFNTSPNIQSVPIGPGVLNGTQTSFQYLGISWYFLQFVLNDGQGQQADTRPEDYGYVQGFLKQICTVNSSLTCGMHQTFVALKALQEFTMNGHDPSMPAIGGFNPIATQLPITAYWPMWSGYSPALVSQLSSAFFQAWVSQASKFTVAQYTASKNTSPTDDPQKDAWNLSLGGILWYELPRLRYLGVSPAVMAQLYSFAKTLYPLGNWTLNQRAVCGAGALTIAQNGCTANGVNIF